MYTPNRNELAIIDHLPCGFVFTGFLSILMLPYLLPVRIVLIALLKAIIKFEKPNLIINDIVTTGCLLLIFFVIGFFISKIECIGFKYYARLYRDKKWGIVHIENDTKIKLPGIIQRILFYIFRDGSIIEFCYEHMDSQYKKIKSILERTDLTKAQQLFYKKVMKRNPKGNITWTQTSKDSLEWINESNDALKDLERYQSDADNMTLYRSKKLHCVDIVFLVIAFICFFLMIINLFIKYPVILPITIGFISFLLHLLMRASSKAWAHRYLTTIGTVIDSKVDLNTKYKSINKRKK